MENKTALNIATSKTSELFNYSGRIVDSEETKNRAFDSAIKATEVYQKLKDNFWFLRDTRYYIEGGEDSKYDYQIRFSEFGDNNHKSGEIDTLDDTSTVNSFPVLTYIDSDNIDNPNKAVEYSQRRAFETSLAEMVDDLYARVFSSALGSEKTFYDSSKTRVSLYDDSSESKSAIIKLITPGSTEYTNRVSLGALLKSNIFHPGSKCILDICINYSRGSSILTKSAMVTLFTYDSGIIKESIDMNLDDELRLYFDKESEILSLSRIDMSIDEYIIEGCIARIMV